MMVPDACIRAAADAVHDVDGLFVLDCIASGAIWVDMKACGVDVLISAPQKGRSASRCCGLVMLGEDAEEHELELLRGQRPRRPLGTVETGPRCPFRRGVDTRRAPATAA